MTCESIHVMQKKSLTQLESTPFLPAFLTVVEVADILRCSTRHVHNLINRGLIPVTRLGRRVVVERAKLLRAVESLTTENPLMEDAR